MNLLEDFEYNADLPIIGRSERESTYHYMINVFSRVAKLQELIMQCNDKIDGGEKTFDAVGYYRPLIQEQAGELLANLRATLTSYDVTLSSAMQDYLNFGAKDLVDQPAPVRKKIHIVIESLECDYSFKIQENLSKEVPVRFIYREKLYDPTDAEIIRLTEECTFLIVSVLAANLRELQDLIDAAAPIDVVVHRLEKPLTLFLLRGNDAEFNTACARLFYPLSNAENFILPVANSNIIKLEFDNHRKNIIVTSNVTDEIVEFYRHEYEKFGINVVEKFIDAEKGYQYNKFTDTM